MGKKRCNKQKLATHLVYSNDVDAKYLDLNVVRQSQCKDEKEKQQMQEICNFVGNLNWAGEESDDCTTWFELYIYFRLNAGNAFFEQCSSIDRKHTIGEELRVFKNYMRKLRVSNLNEEDEWVLQASLARANRLTPLGVQNMHAEVKG